MILAAVNSVIRTEVALLATGVQARQMPALPNPPPVFKTQEIGRTDPVLRVVDFPDERKGMVVRPIYQAGHKCVCTSSA
jgi:hypothetical protein